MHRAHNGARRLGHLLMHAWGVGIYVMRLVWHVLRYGVGRTCPVCGHACRLFKSAGPTRRPDCKCPQCGSRERHRFLWLLMERGSLWKRTLRVIFHVAPEAFLEHRLRESFHGCNYVTGDLALPRAMVRLDLTRLPIADATVDLAFCSHVLGHIADDAAAMRELARIFPPGGVAFVAVPLVTGPTREDPAITEPAEHSHRYGQEDHVRAYGKDFPVRLARAGFDVMIVHPADVLSRRQRRSLGIPDWLEPFFVCRRGA